jgi:AcrR family transcriptional regulator
MGRTRLAIVDAVAECLTARGARRTTMVEIAAAAGIAKGTLYNHVRTRDDAYVLLADNEVGRLIAILDVAAGGDAGSRFASAAEVVANHPVVRALAASEPTALMTVVGSSAATEHFHAQVREALVGVVGVAVADLALRWFLSLLLDGGDADTRAATAALLVGLEGPAD